MRNQLAICFIALGLCSCGFQSPYQSATYDNDLSAIEVESINTIEGAEFYQNLVEILPASQKIKYILKVQFQYVSSPLVIQKNADILRQTVSQLVKYQLLEKETNKQLTSGQFKLLSSYNSHYSAYKTHIESEKTSTNLTKLGAEEIRTRLILYFKNKT
jgi:hypothetical protein